MAIIVVTVVLQVAIVMIGGPVFRTVPLNLEQWLICIVLGAFSMVVGCGLRCMPVPPDKTYSHMSGGLDQLEAEVCPPFVFMCCLPLLLPAAYIWLLLS